VKGSSSHRGALAPNPEGGHPKFNDMRLIGYLCALGVVQVEYLNFSFSFSVGPLYFIIEVGVVTVDCISSCRVARLFQRKSQTRKRRYYVSQISSKLGLKEWIKVREVGVTGFNSIAFPFFLSSPERVSIFYELEEVIYRYSFPPRP
jgi:hypothetical protein